MRKTIALLMMLILATCAATAGAVTFSGTVEASATTEIYAPISGTAEEVAVKAGQKVSADTMIAKIRTTKVYAPEDGTITAIYGQPGDDAGYVAEQYGAVMYLEGNAIYTITASTTKAYEAKENYLVHSGEIVYVRSRVHNGNKGEATVTAVEPSSFTVQISSGLYYVGDSCNVYRRSDFDKSSRLGQGNIERIAPKAIQGHGSIVSYAVQPGDTVTRGQLLFETVEGGYDSLKMTGTSIQAGIDGTIALLNIGQGDTIAKDSVVAVIYPKDAVWVAANVAETDLKEIQIGQPMKIEPDWSREEGTRYEGRVEMISELGIPGENGTTYPVYISFTPDEQIRYGLTVTVSTIGENEPEGKAGSGERTKGEAEPEPETEPEAGTKPEPETEPEAGTEPEPVAETDAGTEPEPETEPEAGMQAEPVTEPETEPEAGTDATKVPEEWEWNLDGMSVVENAFPRGMPATPGGAAQ